MARSINTTKVDDLDEPTLSVMDQRGVRRALHLQLARRKRQDAAMQRSVQRRFKQDQRLAWSHNDNVGE